MKTNKKRLTEEHGKSNVVAFPCVQETDPLEDPTILHMLKTYMGVGVKLLNYDLSVIPESPFKDLTQEEAAHLGLTLPAVLIRAPGTLRTKHIDRSWGNHPLVTSVIVAGWLHQIQVTRQTLIDNIHTYNVPFIRPSKWMEANEYYDEILPQLMSDGIIVIDVDGRIHPSRVLLYRCIESVMWLIDTMVPICEEFKQEKWESKFQVWPDIGKGVRNYVSKTA